MKSTAFCQAVLQLSGHCLLEVIVLCLCCTRRLALLALHRVGQFLLAVLKSKTVDETHRSKKIYLTQSQHPLTEANEFRKPNSVGDAIFSNSQREVMILNHL